MVQKPARSLRRVAFQAKVAGASLQTLGRRALLGPKHPAWSLPFEVAIAVARSSLHVDHNRAARIIRKQVSPIPRALAQQVVLSHDHLDGVEVDVHTPRAFRDGDPTLIYLHGGGYVTCSPASHRELIARIAIATGARCIAPDYRLAPEHPFPAALEDSIRTYKALIADGLPARNLFIGGDSAGGGLAIATLIALRDEGVELPRAAALLSPWVDLSLNRDELHGHGPHDYLNATMLTETAPKYAGGSPLTHPLISPVYADLSGLCPMLVQTGEWEIFHEQNLRFVERALHAGNDVRHEVEPGMLHVFPAFAAMLPQAEQAIRSLGLYVRSFSRSR